MLVRSNDDVYSLITFRWNIKSKNIINRIDFKAVNPCPLSMDTEFDDLQEMVLRDARKKYSEITIEHFMNPHNFGEMSQSDGHSSITGPCGDTIEIWLKVSDGIITEASFETDGCGTSIASGSMVTVLAKGKTLDSALTISPEDILKALDGLPEEKQHCALLASNVLRAAIDDVLTADVD